MSVSLFKVWAPRKWWNQDLSPSQRLKSFLFSCYAGLSQSANPVTVLKTSALRKTAPSELGPLTLNTMNSSLNICITSKPPRWESQVDLSVCEETHLSSHQHRGRKNILIFRASFPDKLKDAMNMSRYFQLSLIYLYFQLQHSSILTVITSICSSWKKRICEVICSLKTTVE